MLLCLWRYAFYNQYTKKHYSIILYSRSKHKKIGIQNYTCETTGGFDINNGFYSHQMVTDSTGTIYLADYGQTGNKKIQIIDTTLIQPDDNQILTNEQYLSLNFNPCGIALYKNLMYISANDGTIRFYNRDKKEFFHTCKSVSGCTFKGAQKLLIVANRL